MNAELFGRNYFSASVLVPLCPTVATIKLVTVEEIGQDREPKMVVYFSDLPAPYADKGLILNVTNRKTLVELFGAETDGWVGKPVRLDVVDVRFGGKPTKGIVVGRA